MNSFLSWIGGKHYLKKIIYEQFPKEIGKYVEVFGGVATTFPILRPLFNNSTIIYIIV